MSAFRRQSAQALPVYAFGTISLYLIDLMLTSRFADRPVDLADWALFKSVAMISGGILMLGLDQAVIRRKVPTRQLLVVSGLQVLIGGSAVWLLLAAMDASVSAAIAAAAGAALAVLGIIAGQLRSEIRIPSSQFAQQSWKVLALVLITGGLAGEQAVVLAVTSTAVIAAIALLAIQRPDDSALPSASVSDLYPVAFRFAGFSMVASLAAYLDQVLLHITGNVEASGEYFAYFTLFVAPGLFVLSFAANVGNPWIRDRANRVLASPKWHLFAVACGTCVLLIGCLALGLLLGRYTGKFEVAIDWRLIGIALTIVMVRALYFVPSLLLGVFATRRELDSFLLASFLMIPILVASFLGLTRIGWDPVIAIASSVAIGNSFRCLAGWYLSVRLWSSRSELRPAI